MDFKIIAVDFDGTLCENQYPNIGVPNIELINYLKNRQRSGDKLILWTCRSHEDLEEAILWCDMYDLHFDGVNENLEESIENYEWDSRKIFAHEYIDDRMNTSFNLPYIPKNKRCAYETRISNNRIWCYGIGDYIEQCRGYDKCEFYSPINIHLDID